MKRIYVAILFLSIAIGLCVFEQITVNTSYNQANKYLDNAIKQVEKSDYENAEKTCRSLDEYWSNRLKYLSAMIDHASLDDTSVTIATLKDLAKNKSDNLEKELLTAKNQIKSIRDNQKITFGNVF